MSITFCDVLVDAILSAASKPGRAERRFHLSTAYGARADEVFDVMEGRLERAVTIESESGPREIRGISVGSSVLIPYLVSASSPSANSGSRGFAATLRTQFLAGDREGPRVLLVLDASPVETVLSASEDIMELEELAWHALLARAARLESARRGEPVPGFANQAFEQLSKFGPHDAEVFGRFLDWLDVAFDDGAEPAGRELWRLGCFLSDPDAFDAQAPPRWDESARFRRELDELYRSQARPFESEVRRKFARKVDPQTIEALASAAGPFELNYKTFTVRDLLARAQALQRLQTDPISPANGAQATVRSDHNLVLWAPSAACDLTLRLNREARAGERLLLRLSGGAELDTSLTAGQAHGAMHLSDAPSGTWSFGTLEVRTLAGTRTQISETLSVAIYRSDAEWFPIENALKVDPGREGFVCEHDPDPVALARGGAEVGHAGYPSLPEGLPERLDLATTFHGETAMLPVLLLGSGGDEPEPGGDEEEEPLDDGDEAAGDDGDEAEGDGGEDGNGRVSGSYASVPYGMLDTEIPSWPDSARTQSGEVTGAGADGSDQTFQLGARRCRLVDQRPAGLSGSDIERQILDRPEWFSYSWSEGSRTIQRALDELRPHEGFDPALVGQFTETRAAFFAAAASAGTVYLLDPRGPEASAYVDAYRGLLAQLPESGRYRSEWDFFLLCDAVWIAGTQEFLLAPTSPLAVAFHSEMARRFATWIGDGDIPHHRDVLGVTLRHALPLVNAGGRWYESAQCTGALWRHYVPLSEDAPGVPERNAGFIARRLHFFLDVHDSYRRPDQTLAVAFANPSDAESIVRALDSFYWKERDAENYSLPRLEVNVIGGPPGIQRAFAGLIAGGEQTAIRRLVQSRVTITCIDSDEERRPFAHVTFLLRSPGRRAPHANERAARAPTTYLNGLAAAPGRFVDTAGEQLFAWGTWAPADDGASHYRHLLRRGLELVAGQHNERLEPGWTKMAATTVDHRRLAELYDQSVWVVHLDRLIGIEAFGALRGSQDRQLIDYEERANPDQPGFDGITATERVEPYLAVVTRALSDLGVPSDAALKRILRLLNAVSGRWAIQLLHRSQEDILERIGLVMAIAATEQLEKALGARKTGTGVLIALDELLGRRSHAGVPRISLPVPLPEGKTCDDLLLLWIPDDAAPDEPLPVRGTVIEVKYATTGGPDLDHAVAEISRTRMWLESTFNTTGSSRPFRSRDMADLVRGATSRAETFNLGRPPRGRTLERALTRIAAGDYVLDLRHWRAGRERTGMVVAVEAESRAPASQRSLSDVGGPVDLLRLARPALDQLVAGKELSARGNWEPISFAPSAGEGPRGVPAPGALPAPPASPEPPPAAPRADTGAEPEPGEPAEVERLGAALDSALQKYKLPCEPCQPELAQVGPNVIRFRTRPLGPLSISAIEGKARDLGREIGALGAVIVTQEPGYVCIDVPRERRQAVRFSDVAAMAGGENAPGALGFVLGTAPSGEVRTGDLARLPHLLVAGATGSGKSVFLRGMLCSLVRTSGPEALRIMLIDPKQLDFAGFSALPHLVGGRIISDAAEAVEELQGTIEEELAWRRPRLIEAGVTSATEFYERGGQPGEFPQMVVLVDEFADLASVLEGQQRKEFLDAIQRYAQVTRAFGIYLVLATQRPSVDVITGTIKANLTARIALSLPSHRDSMTILDRPGAEDLLGNGDMLFYYSGQVERLQGAFADATDVAQAVERWRGAANPDAPH